MGLFRRIGNFLTGRGFRDDPPRRPTVVPPPLSLPLSDDGGSGPQWGEPFGTRDIADNLSAEGKDFQWYVAGVKFIRGQRDDLEKTPNRVLTDAELRRADYLVIYFSPAIGYITLGGPWDDWDDLWGEIADYYDTGGS